MTVDMHMTVPYQLNAAINLETQFSITNTNNCGSAHTDTRTTSIRKMHPPKQKMFILFQVATLRKMSRCLEKNM